MSLLARVATAGRAPHQRMAMLRPVQVGLLAGAVALAVVGLRLAIAADGDITRFVVAGDVFVDAEAPTPAGADLHVFRSPGYDGQFFWRLAVDPWSWGQTADHGVRFDTGYRTPRIGYPLVAHLLAGGRPELVAWSLVAVNVVAIGLVAFAGACVSERAGSPAAWGLAVASASGLVMALGRDLAECVTVAAVVGGVALLQRGRPIAAAAAWSLAVLTREQALLVVASYGLSRVLALVNAGIDRRRRAPGPEAIPTGDGPVPAERWAHAPWLVPVVVFLGWQALLWRRLGALPLLDAGGGNLVPPFTDLVPGLGRWLAGDLGRIHAVAPAQLALTVALVAAAAGAARAVSSSDRYLVAALGLSALAATCLAASIWRDPSDLRHLVDLTVLSWLVLLVARRPPPAWAGALAALVWLATAAARVVAI